MKRDLVMGIKRILAGRRGRNFNLENGLEDLSVEALRDLLNVLRDFDQELSSEKRSFRPFPGGPRIRG